MSHLKKAFIQSDYYQYYQRINLILHKYFCPINKAAKNNDLNKAMAYSLLNGGKRLRPLLVYAAGKLVNAPLSKLDRAAAAIECIHAYSLIHDDLPAMDDDNYRRGKLSCHKKFSESTAILAGDALQSFAFEILADNKNTDQIKILAGAIGKSGMALGQLLDIDYQIKKNKISFKRLSYIHYLKTAKLICASVLLGALCGNYTFYNNKKLFTALLQFGENFGLAFQLRDDRLDQEINKLYKKYTPEYFFQNAENILIQKLQPEFPRIKFLLNIKTIL